MNNISLNPKFITIDFEQAAILAIKLIFPNAIIKGCNFILINVFIPNYKI